MLIEVPFEGHVPDESLPAYATLEFDALIYLCNRKNVEPIDNLAYERTYSFIDF